ncbi:MAG: putative photosynthetic complex assembly protein PuhE [Aestuariivita sp.]|nr:putative photosynthetic complex assembly protein PuhE [Aestuariivita sp.]
MITALIAVLIAFLVWWLATGAILMVAKYADKRGARARQYATLMALPMLLGGFWGYAISLNAVSASGTYIAFFATLAIWGWIELAFLTGIVTGPICKPLPSGVSEFERFLRAWGTLAFHEILLVGTLISLIVAGWGAENTFGMWTFIVLYVARISAKFNLYFGVPKINIEFLPTVLMHLSSHFRIRRMNWVFPISISILTFAVACWLERLYAATAIEAVIGFSLLTAITALALFEHWMMVLPLPDERLWRWMLPADTAVREPHSSLSTRQEDAHGL